jgi:hypothetical protein
MNADRRRQAYERARVRARHFVYERLALLTAVIWAGGTALLFIGTVPITARPGPQIMVSMLIPMIPAALPWLFYGRISDALARRWADREIMEFDRDSAA